MAKVFFPNIRDVFTAGGKIAYANGEKLPTRYPQVVKTIVDHSQIIKKLLTRPTNETRELVAEFNPALLNGKSLYQNWKKICCDNLEASCPFIKQWLTVPTKLECEKN